MKLETEVLIRLGNLSEKNSNSSVDLVAGLAGQSNVGIATLGCKLELYWDLLSVSLHSLINTVMEGRERTQLGKEKQS